MINTINPIYVEKAHATRRIGKKKEKSIFEAEKTKKNTEQVLSKQEFVPDNLYFIQEQQENSYKNKDYDYAEAVLHLLLEYRKSVLFGNSSLKQLQEIKDILTFSKPNMNDDKMATVIEEIDILAKVELAKRGII